VLIPFVMMRCFLTMEKRPNDENLCLESRVDGQLILVGWSIRLHVMMQR
jgi:hypothetical protein